MTLTDLYTQLFGKGAIKNGDVIGMAEHGRVGGVSSGQGFKFTADIDESLEIQSSGTDTFIGEAKPGTALSAASWKAYKVDNEGTLTYADGNANYDNVATDLTSLTYS